MNKVKTIAYCLMVLLTGCHKKLVKYVELDLPVTIVDSVPVETILKEQESPDSWNSGHENEGEEKPILATAHFAFDSAKISPDDRERLMAIVGLIKANPGKVVTILGFCDERGSEAYNKRLGFRRGYSVRDFLKARAKNTDFKVISYGEGSPSCSDRTEECWAENRRAEVVLE